MNSNSDPPRVTTRSMTAKRKAEETETDAAKKTRLSGQPLRQHESQGVITRSMAAKIKLEAAAEEEKATMNVVIAKRGKRRRQRSSKKLRFSGPYLRQRWSLPESIMYYIIKNPTPESHEKLIQCCKYFFAKNPVFVIRDLKFRKGKWKTSIEKEPLDIAKIAESKLWIYGTFSVISFTDPNIVSSIIPKINRCDIKSLDLCCQTVSYKDFVFLASSVERFATCRVTIEYHDDSIVPLEKIVEVLPKVKKISYCCNPFLPVITSATFKELVKLPQFSQLRNFCCRHVPDTFDLDAFYSYMKKNKFTKFAFNFHESISEAFKNRLESIMDEILDAQTYDYKPPVFYFSGIDETKFDKLYDIFDSH